MIKTEKYIEYLFSAALKKYGSIPDEIISSMTLL